MADEQKKVQANLKEDESDTSPRRPGPPDRHTSIGGPTATLEATRINSADLRDEQGEAPRNAGGHERSEGAISLVPQLLSVSKTIRALHENKMFSLGFHRGQDEFLLAVDAEGETVSHIADRLAIRPSTVSKMIDRLGEKGLAERLGDARDARRTLIRLTPEGAKMRDPLLAARLELESDIVKGLKPEAIAVITDELVRFADHLAARLRRLR